VAKEIDPSTRIVIVRRGELMRVNFPFTQYALDTTSPAELALAAAMMIMELQMSYPGRADMPITSKTPQMGLFLPFHDEPLPDEPLWSVLAGEWRPFDLEIVGAMADEFTVFPCAVVNLKDLPRGAAPNGTT
jgi:hypothetical protein